MYFSPIIGSFCPPLDPPVGGIQSCEDWGPGGRFKVCRIACNEGLKFSGSVPQFYTCGAEGFWRPNPNAQGRDPAVAPFVYPACSKTQPAQKIFKLKLDYLTDVLCNDAGKVTNNFLETLIACSGSPNTERPNSELCQNPNWGQFGFQH